jgi:3-phosphoshikimate 1-carboxyvinyltransferase
MAIRSAVALTRPVGAQIERPVAGPNPETRGGVGDFAHRIDLAGEIPKLEDPETPLHTPRLGISLALALPVPVGRDPPMNAGDEMSESNTDRCRAITPLTSRASEAFVAQIPGSKSYTNRALLIGAQRVGETQITGGLHCDDTDYLASCLDGFAGLEVTKTNQGFCVSRSPGDLGAPGVDLYIGAAGTPARFLLSFAAGVRGGATITGNARLSERPMSDLLDALTGMGIATECLATEGCLPVRVSQGVPQTRQWSIHGGVSSQFLSSLILHAAQQPEGPIEIRVMGHLVSRSYVRMTLRMLADQGIKVEERADDLFVVYPGQPANSEIPVEVDASGMSYFLVAAAITGTRVLIPGIGMKSAQGDVGLANALEQMGCRVEARDDGLLLEGGPLRGIEIDMETMPDTVLSLAIAAAVAEGETRITNIANLRVKECDRIAAAANELGRLGIEVVEGDDYLIIRPGGAIRPARVHTYDDHRVAMSFGLLRLLYEGIEIEDPDCVAKSFPGFWTELARFKAHHEGSA